MSYSNLQIGTLSFINNEFRNFFQKGGRVISNLPVFLMSNDKQQLAMEKKYYLWYDEITKSFIVGKASDFILPKSEILFSADQTQLGICRRIAKNLNQIA